MCIWYIAIIIYGCHKIPHQDLLHGPPVSCGTPFGNHYTRVIRFYSWSIWVESGIWKDFQKKEILKQAFSNLYWQRQPKYFICFRFCDHGTHIHSSYLPFTLHLLSHTQHCGLVDRSHEGFCDRIHWRVQPVE